ncbi:hypothetical protein C4D60_Mb10t08880 [Musa balbisiana]|uniref:Proteasome assembly chaperone 1 n=1 Tax=Musa balbisiana TaxID=52838 RepID=A0A4S8IVP1_MUSBA|nr:hypothetical protein C4D60_Mb10t08880 [Musa balbisiana]
MEDVVTESPPPSRFFQEDLDNFAAPPPPLPQPLLLLDPKLGPDHIRPTLLIVALSAPSLAILHRIPHKILIGTLILPETPLAGNSLEPCPRDRSCYIYAVDHRPSAAVLVAVQFPVAAERARAVAKSLLGAIQAERVLIFDSIGSQNYRGRLAVDETLAFKLATVEERSGGQPLVQGVDYLPSGSVMDGLGAAVIAECQMRRAKGTLVATWPANGRSTVVPIIRSLLQGLSIDVGWGLMRLRSIDCMVSLYTLLEDGSGSMLQVLLITYNRIQYPLYVSSRESSIILGPPRKAFANASKIKMDTTRKLQEAREQTSSSALDEVGMQE